MPKEIGLTMVILVLVAMSPICSVADEVVRLQDGRAALLKDDGTWSISQTTIDSLPASQFDFRRTRWGMTISEVKQSESLTVQAERADYIGYKTKTDGRECMLIYVFARDTLVRAKYVFTDRHTNENDYMLDYAAVQSRVIDKYGRPKSDERIWSDHLYQNEPDRYGFAVSLGHLVLQSEWKNPATLILLQLSGDNYKITHQLEYTSNLYHRLEEEVKGEKSKGEL